MAIDQKDLDRCDSEATRCWKAAISCQSQPINPSGVAYDLLAAINGVLLEQGDVTTEHAVSLMVHALKGTLYFPSYDFMFSRPEAIEQSKVPANEVRGLVVKFLERCANLREVENRGSEGLIRDEGLHSLAIRLYYSTLAWHYDCSTTIWSYAEFWCKQRQS